MDLRRYDLSTAQLGEASRVLDYQPFYIADDLQTGAAYCLLHSNDPRLSPPLVFRRAEWESEWDKISDANSRLRDMYEDFIKEIAERYPGGSLFDVACNNGYFPVRAASLGMKNCAGSDRGFHFADSIRLLNDVVGTDARFLHAPYDPVSGSMPLDEVFDVVVVSAILCHLPDPLHFLRCLGRIAREAIFFWGQMIDSDELIISYKPPHPNLSEVRPFPYCFNDNTRLSRGLFEESMIHMGFRQVLALPAQPGWLFTQRAPAPDGNILEHELKIGSAHVAFLAIH
jgi:SAM-dependent methyltransferase